MWGWGPDIVGLRGLALLGFSAVGACIGVARFGSLLSTHRWTVVDVGALALILALPFFGQELVPASVPAAPAQWDAGRAAWLAPSVIAAWSGQFILAGAAVLVWQIPRAGGWVALVGRHTLSIYLAHIIVIAGLRIVLVGLGIESAPMLMPILVISGVLVPLAAERILQPTPLRFIFDTPPALLRAVEHRRPHAG